jgi:hypothetical protein
VGILTVKTLTTYTFFLRLPLALWPVSLLGGGFEDCGIWLFRLPVAQFRQAVLVQRIQLPTGDTLRERGRHRIIAANVWKVLEPLLRSMP